MLRDPVCDYNLCLALLSDPFPFYSCVVVSNLTNGDIKVLVIGLGNLVRAIWVSFPSMVPVLDLASMRSCFRLLGLPSLFSSSLAVAIVALLATSGSGDFLISDWSFFYSISFCNDSYFLSWMYARIFLSTATKSRSSKLSFSNSKSTSF